MNTQLRSLLKQYATLLHTVAGAQAPTGDQATDQPRIPDAELLEAAAEHFAGAAYDLYLVPDEDSPHPHQWLVHGTGRRAGRTRRFPDWEQARRALWLDVVAELVTTSRGQAAVLHQQVRDGEGRLRGFVLVVRDWDGSRWLTAGVADDEPFVVQDPELGSALAAAYLRMAKATHRIHGAGTGPARVEPLAGPGRPA